MNPHAHPATSDVQTVKMIHDVIRDSFILVFSIADDLHSCFDRFIALSVQVFVFAGQATKDKTDKTDTKPIGSGQAVNRL